MEEKNNKNTYLIIGGVVVLVLIIGGILILGRGGGQTNSQPTPISDSSSQPVSNQDPNQTADRNANVLSVNVSATEFSFSPSTLSFKAGQQVKVTFTNNGKFPHNFTIPELNVTTANVNPGESGSVDFTVPSSGTLSYVCTVDSHKDKGMVGTIKIE